MGKTILMFGDIDIEKKKTLPPYKIYFFNRCWYRKALVPREVSTGEKTMSNLLVTCIIYHDVKPLHIMLQQASIYLKGYDERTKWM